MGDEVKECLICHERPVANAPDAAACGVCMLADLRRVMSERDAAERKLAAEKALREDWQRIGEARLAEYEREKARAEKAEGELRYEANRSDLYASEVSRLEESLAAARRECERLRKAVEMALQRFDDDIHCRRPRIHALKYAEALRAALAAPAAGEEGKR